MRVARLDVGFFRLGLVAAFDRAEQRFDKRQLVVGAFSEVLEAGIDRFGVFFTSRFSGSIPGPTARAPEAAEKRRSPDGGPRSNGNESPPRRIEQ